MDLFVERFDEHLLFALERRYLDMVDPERLELAMNPVMDSFDYRSHLRMIRLDEVSHEGQERQGLHLLHMQNVLAAMKDDSHTLVSVVRGDGNSTSLYYGLARHLGARTTHSTHEYSRMLGSAIHGNFLGARFTPLSADETWDQVIAPLAEHGHAIAFPGIPSLRVREPDAPYVQGIDRFIEGMRGEDYCLVSIAEPIRLPVIDGMVGNLFDLGSSIHAQVRATIQKMKGSSDTVNLGMFGFQGAGDSHTEGVSQTNSDVESNSSTRMGIGSVLAGVATPLLGFAGFVLGGPLGAVVGGSLGQSIPWATGSPMSYSDAFSRASSFTRSVANTTSNMTGMGGTAGYARGWNRSTTVGREELNKTAEHCEKLTDAYVQRLQKGKNLGFWSVGVYLLTKNKYTQLRAKGLLRASFSGDETYWEPVRSVNVNSEAIGKYLLNFSNPRYNLFLYGEETPNVAQAVNMASRLKSYASRMGRSVAELLGLLKEADPKEQIRILEEIRNSPADFSRKDIDQAWARIKEVQLGHPLGPALGGVSTPLNTEELSIIMNVPRQEVQGVTIRPATSFGVNYTIPPKADSLRLGRVVHKRTPVDSMPYLLPREILQKHLFVCGVTGSGKTNTCVGILRSLELPFMVIEPAKTEYRQTIQDLPNLKIFTLGSETISPFRINPFEFCPGSNLLTHIDNLKSVFSAAFPMYAAMPYILEEAIIEVYRDKGWELASSTNVYLESDSIGTQDEESPISFFDFLPTLQDLYEKIDDVVGRKQYAQEQTMNYSAALKARLSSLLTGSKGLMLNTRRSTPMETLLNEQVVLELKYIGDDEEKCFMMGLIFSAIYEFRERYGKPGSTLQHVLLIEEAHRLLRRVPDFVSPEVGNNRGKSVETFSNVISEIRTFGQGLVVVDQIPSKLAQDVIKNTNMKVVHRTLAKDDREYVGSTMNLTDEQSRELALLEVGRAVAHREGMDKAFLVQMDFFQSSTSDFVQDANVKEIMTSFHKINSYVFQRLSGFEIHPDIPSHYAKMDFRYTDKSIYFSIMGGFTLMLLGELEELPVFQRDFYDMLERSTRHTSNLSKACYVIHFSSLLFSELNAKYSGCYDRCVQMNRVFIEFWFAFGSEIGFNSSAIMSENRKDEMLRLVKENMRLLRRSEKIFIPFWAYYVNRIDVGVNEQIKSNWNGSLENMEDLDRFIQSGMIALVGRKVRLKENSQRHLAEQFLNVLFWTDPRMSSVIEQYQDFKGW